MYLFIFLFLFLEAKRAASKTGYSDSGSCRTTTPSSDMTSSDEACSSCQEDMLAANKHILVDKIHQDGKRVSIFLILVNLLIFFLVH